MADNQEPVPGMQKLYDNIPLIFLLSLVIMIISYTLWGIIDFVSRGSG